MKTPTVRRAGPDDAMAIHDLLFEAEKLILHMSRDDVSRMLKRQNVYLLKAESQLAGVCGLAIGPETVAQIRVFALQENWATREVLPLLLPEASRDLSGQGVTTVAFIGLEQWLLDGLATQGFRRVNTIITLQKADFEVPDRGNPRVAVRPARAGDFPAVLAIDEASFVPLWRSTDETLDEYLSQSPNFCVAELGGTVVGYACLSIVGRHGHVTRLVVHPSYQGQRIAVRLLTVAIDYFRKRRMFGITLNTQRDNQRARRLYEWYGFRALGREAQVMVLDV
jgi:[ribosomal protein S18]-alanine N-acetyltransferase